MRAPAAPYEKDTEQKNEIHRILTEYTKVSTNCRVYEMGPNGRPPVRYRPGGRLVVECETRSLQPGPNGNGKLSLYDDPNPNRGGPTLDRVFVITTREPERGAAWEWLEFEIRQSRCLANVFHSGKPAVRVYKVGSKMQRHLGGVVDEQLDLSFEALSEASAGVIRLMPTRETFVRFHTEPNPEWEAMMAGKDANGRAVARAQNMRLAPHTVTCTKTVGRWYAGEHGPFDSWKDANDSVEAEMLPLQQQAEEERIKRMVEKANAARVKPPHKKKKKKRRVRRSGAATVLDGDWGTFRQGVDDDDDDGGEEHVEGWYYIPFPNYKARDEILRLLAQHNHSALLTRDVLVHALAPREEWQVAVDGPPKSLSTGWGERGEIQRTCVLGVVQGVKVDSLRGGERRPWTEWEREGGG